MGGSDWYGWHDDYARSDSTLARRLAAVQQQVRTALDTAPAGPLRVVSMCAGQGRDLLEVLADHPRRAAVTARLVELDPRNAEVARDRAAAAGLDQVEVVVGDAGLTDQYADLAPADLVLACGVFGNITDPDIRRTVVHCAQLCRPGGVVVWTRGRVFEDERGSGDLVPQICKWYEEAGFTREWVSDPAEKYGVGVHRYAGEPEPLATGVRMFTFVR